MSARHRISKMLLRHGRVYPKPTAWKQDHRRWLASQHFDEPMSELVYLNLLAQVDALTSRKLELAGQIARIATAAVLPGDRHADRVIDPSRARR